MTASKPASDTTQSIVIERELTHPPEKVWRALTDAALVATWLMPNDLRAEVGHEFTFRTKPAPGFDGVARCKVLVVEPPRKLSYTFTGGSADVQGYGHALDTVITWTLTPTASGTLLRLEHSGFTASAAIPFKMMQHGWGEIVQTRLPNVLAGMADEGEVRPM